MIDLQTEKLITLREAAALLPSRKPGRRVHVVTVYRWAGRGVRGVQLETLRTGGALVTSVEAVQRFVEQLGVVYRGEPPPRRTARRRETEIAAAEAEMQRAGY